MGEHVRTLADGNRIPLVGLGVWQVPNGPEEARRSAKRLGVQQVDRYIVHYPQGGPTWAWPGVEAAKPAGYARSIGVSNFSAGQLDQVMSSATTPPMVNQVQFSPLQARQRLLAACAERGVQLEAYSPLGTGRDLRSREVRTMAERLGRTPAQVLLRWSRQRGTVVISKSTHRDRIAENAAIFDFELSEDDMAALDALDRTGGTNRAREQKWWEDGEAEPTLSGKLRPVVAAGNRKVEAPRAVIPPRRRWVVDGGRPIPCRPMPEPGRAICLGTLRGFRAPPSGVPGICPKAISASCC
jgi:diketogulonate reductase-like aldo/keto reductase